MTIENADELRERNQERLQALARAGTPVQINGFEQHALVFLIEHALGAEALEALRASWEQKVSETLDAAEQQVRMARFLAPGAGNGMVKP